MVYAAIDRHTNQMQQCIQDCLDCWAICLNTLTYSLKQFGSPIHADHAPVLIDCAGICQLAANFMARGSELHPKTCALAAEICDRCAATCEKQDRDPHMKTCADACRRCAASCREMTALSAAPPEEPSI